MQTDPAVARDRYRLMIPDEALNAQGFAACRAGQTPLTIGSEAVPGMCRARVAKKALRSIGLVQ